MNQGNCKHTDEERCIVGTWVVEVREAIEMGYILMDVLEFWQYEITCFDRGTNSEVLFAEYVNVPEIETGIVRLPILGSE